MRSLYSVKIERDATPAAVEKEVARRVRAHTGRRTDAWEVTVAAFATPDKKKPSLHIVTLSEVPGRRFVLSSGLVSEVGETFPSLLKKMSLYEPRATRVIRGATYDFADLVVRVGISFDRGAPAGVVVEIEYRPCAIADACVALVGELMDRIVAPLVPTPQAGQDPSASAAATVMYTYERITSPVSTADAASESDPVGETAVDAASAATATATEEAPAAAMQPFSHRHAAALYVKLLS
jgi:TATA-binding related factor (TRF) of subunit 20 of Mediator complex